MASRPPLRRNLVLVIETAGYLRRDLFWNIALQCDPPHGPPVAMVVIYWVMQNCPVHYLASSLGSVEAKHGQML